MIAVDRLAAVEAALADAPHGAIVISAMSPLDDVLKHIRSSESPMIVVLAGPDLADVDRAMLLAVIGPLAIERAPQGRIGALDIAPSASHTAIAAAARFLAEAESTTGQVLTVA